MLTAAIAFIPFLTCLFWLVLNPLVRKPDRQSRTLELLLAVTGTVSIAQAAVYYSTGTALLVFFMIKQFFTPLLVPAALLYVSHLNPAITWKPYIPAWLGIPIALLFAESVLLMLSGTDGFTGAVSNTAGADDKVAYLINLCSFSIFYTFLALQVTVWIILAIARLIKGKHHIQMLNCTVLILAVAALEASAITGMPQWMGTVISVITASIIFITLKSRNNPTNQAP